MEGERGADLGVEIGVAVEVDHRKGLSLQLLQKRPVVGHPELLPARPGELRVALGPFTGSPLERLANRDRVSDHPDRLRVKIAPQLEDDQHAGVLHPDRSAGNRAQDLVAPAKVAATQTHLPGRLPPGAAAAHQDCVVKLVELADLAVAASIEARSLRHWPKLHAVVLNRARHRRGAAPVHPQHRHEGLRVQLRGKSGSPGRHPV